MCAALASLPKADMDTAEAAALQLSPERGCSGVSLHRLFIKEIVMDACIAGSAVTPARVVES